MNEKLVSIIIANYNGEKYLKPCLVSLLKTKYQNYEIIIIDDGSTDNSVKIIKSFKKVILLRNKHNKGAATSRNIAANSAKGEIILFLDNDTQVLPNTITELVKSLTKSRQIGAVQSLIIDYHDRDKIQMAGGKLIKQVFWLEPYNQNDSYSKQGNFLKSKNIIAISACLAVKKEVFTKTGGFSSLLNIYTEDIEFCLKIWLLGYKVMLAPTSIVYHWTKTITERKNMNAYLEQIYFNLAKNSFVSIFANYEYVNVLKYLPVSVAVNLFRGIYILIRKGSVSAIIGTSKAFIWFVENIHLVVKYRQQNQKLRSVTDEFLFSKIFSKKSLIKIYRNYYI